MGVRCVVLISAQRKRLLPVGPKKKTRVETAKGRPSRCSREQGGRRRAFPQGPGAAGRARVSIVWVVGGGTRSTMRRSGTKYEKPDAEQDEEKPRRTSAILIPPSPSLPPVYPASTYPRSQVAGPGKPPVRDQRETRNPPPRSGQPATDDVHSRAEAATQTFSFWQADPDGIRGLAVCLTSPEGWTGLAGRAAFEGARAGAAPAAGAGWRRAVPL